MTSHTFVPLANIAAAVKDEIEASWLTDEIRARRKADALRFVRVIDDVARPYDGELEEMIETGKFDVEPEGDRVLTRAVLPEDAMGGGLVRGEIDSRKAICHVVVAVGAGVAKWEADNGARPLKPGEYVWILATVSDRMSNKDKTCRLWTTPRKYISARLTPRT